MRASLIVFLLLWPFSVLAQGFAGLGTDAGGFKVPVAGQTLVFPRDHGPHPAYRIEWWYVTANLRGADGKDYGVQWTLFRNALAPHEGADWGSPQVWLGHAGLTTPDAHYAAERFARGGIGQAGAAPDALSVWIDEWSLQEGAPWNMTAGGADWRYDLTMEAQGPLVLHGDHGFSVKSAEGQASYYYSQPFLSVSGTITTPEGGEVQVTGKAWLDREWSSQPLAANQTGWDWFSLSFDSGDKLMGFRLRDSDGGAYTSATWIAADGQTTSYPDGAFSAEPLEMTDVAGTSLPTAWHVRLPERGVDATVRAINAAAVMPLSVPYWEGPVRIEGKLTGVGYLEMTGYLPAR